jgi:predicted kinase
MSEQAPLLVIVSGPGASGKSTLARRLAGALALARLSRDELTELLADLLGTDGLPRTEELGRAAFGLMYALGERFLQDGAGVVLDQAFQRGLAEAQLAPLVARARAVQVHCWLPPEECVRRYVARYERGERHAAHFDGERIARVRSGARRIDWSRFEPLDLGVPTLRVDTWRGYRPDFQTILAFVRSGGR